MIPQTIPLIQNIGISVLQAQNRQRFRSFLNVTIAIISIFIGYHLTQAYGIIGCALSTSLALLIGHGFILNWYYLTKIHLEIITFWKQIIHLSIPFIISCLFIFFVSIIFTSNNLIFLVGKMILYTVLCFTFFWSWGFNSFEKSQIITPLLRIKTKLRI